MMVWVSWVAPVSAVAVYFATFVFKPVVAKATRYER